MTISKMDSIGKNGTISGTNQKVTWIESDGMTILTEIDFITSKYHVKVDGQPSGNGFMSA